jgi:23S rRNA U2552 (ribose-2'-O)-methylase RlmE/FtsJ
MYKYKIPILENEQIFLPTIKQVIINTNFKGFANIMSINLEYVNKLNKCKDKISAYNNTIWEDFKKITNPYEYIYVFNGKNTYKGIAKLKPLSRSFFKMVEMIHEFYPTIITKNTETDTNQTVTPIKTIHLAEGPGGFIEATRYVRNNNKNDRLYGMTLIDSNNSVPCWHQSKVFLSNNPEVKILYGADTTGNIYNPANIKYLINEVGENTADLVTGDGGFDFSIDYNYQEQASSKLIYCQIITALKTQKIGGTFICKIFDMSNYLTIEMLYILYYFYEDVTIYKPLTSRIANSEKYVICKGFKSITTEYWTKLIDLLNYWNKIEREVDKHKHHNTINYIFESIPRDFVINLKKINMEIIDSQILSINSTIEMIKNNKIYNNPDWNLQNRTKQIAKAQEWCKRYNIPTV